jgi:hypothetical protein
MSIRNLLMSRQLDPPLRQWDARERGQAEGRGVGKQYIIQDGEMSYEVVPDNVNLNEHLGHKITISGTSNERRRASR